MISRRYFATIFILMAVIFFLFQFSEVAKDASNDYEINKYEELTVSKNMAYTPANGTVADTYEDDSYILFLGDTTSDTGCIVREWALYAKRDLMECENIADFSAEKNGKPEFLIVDSACVDFDTDLQTLEELAESGVSMVFANLPEVEMIEQNEELAHFFGISSVRESSIKVDGIKLFSGFLLGGEVSYEPKKKSEEKRQDLELTMPWYTLTGGVKTYMVGMLDDYFDKDYAYTNDMLPAVIWRCSKGEGQVFCINGDYMSDTTGIGILSACIYELSSYQLYPVVNAQNTLVVNFPILADENTAKLQQIYSRSAHAFQNEIAWPTLIAFCERNDLKYTCLVSPKYNYEDSAKPSLDLYPDLLKQLNEKESEIGASLQYEEGTTSLVEKAALDQDYYDEQALKYTYTSAFLSLSDVGQLSAILDEPYLKNVRTFACSEDVRVPILSYLTDDITLQSLTSNTKDFSYSRDLMLKSVETALGYDNAELNISDVIWPQQESDHWEYIYDDMSSSLSTYWTPFKVFDQTTLTESDARVRTFLNLSCTSKRVDDTITLQIEGRGEDTAYFVLRTHGDVIDSIEGATYEEIEDYAYLIAASEDQVRLQLKEEDALRTFDR